jgi:hypothetical protein
VTVEIGLTIPNFMRTESKGSIDLFGLLSFNPATVCLQTQPISRD